MNNDATKPGATPDEEREERQRINAEMAWWFGIGVTRCTEHDCDCGGEWNRWEV